MTLHLVRHASAGSRGGWSGDDLERPLDETGAAQANALCRHLARGAPIRAIWSSLATRCVQTVAPLAAAVDLQVELRRELTEGARAAALADLLRAEAAEPGDLVLCSHGDLIPEVVGLLTRGGMTVTGPRGWAKGSVWALETHAGRITRARYVAAPASG